MLTSTHGGSILSFCEDVNGGDVIVEFVRSYRE